MCHLHTRNFFHDLFWSDSHLRWCLFAGILIHGGGPNMIVIAWIFEITMPPHPAWILTAVAGMWVPWRHRLEAHWSGYRRAPYIGRKHKHIAHIDREGWSLTASSMLWGRRRRLRPLCQSGCCWGLCKDGEAEVIHERGLLAGWIGFAGWIHTEVFHSVIKRKHVPHSVRMFTPRKQRAKTPTHTAFTVQCTRLV